jgi:hypothetical protein
MLSPLLGIMMKNRVVFRCVHLVQSQFEIFVTGGIDVFTLSIRFVTSQNQCSPALLTHTMRPLVKFCICRIFPLYSVTVQHCMYAMYH